MDIAIKKPKITLMFLVLLLIVGTITFFQLPKREIPEFTYDIGSITTIYPGATPEKVEREITSPLERDLQAIIGIREMTSVSAAGVSNITIQLQDGTDKTAVFAKIRNVVSQVSSTFSDEVISPTIREDIQMGALSSYHILSPDREKLYQLRDSIEQWQTEIEGIPGVRGTIVKGIPQEELVISLETEKMTRKGIILPQVLNSLKGEFETIPLGTQQSNDSIVQLSIATYQSITDIEKIYVGLSAGNEAVYVSDIGNVELRSLKPKDYITYNGTPALSFTVLPEQGVDIPSLQKKVDERLELLTSDLPEQVTIDLFYTQNTIVAQIFKDLSISFIISIFAVIIITLLGMNLISAIIVALAIPTSIILGLIPLPYLGVDLNQISIIGFIIALGILVDDAIVVNDNIQRRYRLGDGALKGALIGTREVRVSIITSTLAVVFTFFPLLFLSGGNGDFIRALPSVLITTIIASTIVSLTLVPIYSSWRRNNSKNEQVVKLGILGGLIERLANWYSEKILKRVVKTPVKISIIGLVVCTLAYGLIPFIPIVFFPSADRSEVTVDVTLPVGITMERTNDYLLEIANQLAEDEAIKEISIYTGAGLPGLFGQVMTGSGENTGQILLRVDREKQKADETIAKWTGQLRGTFQDAEIKMTTIETGPPVGAPIAIKVAGPQLNELMKIVTEIKQEIELLEGSGVVVDDIGSPLTTIVYEPNREVVEKHGFTLREISEQIRLVTLGFPFGNFDTGKNNVNMRVIVDEVAKGEQVDMSELFLPSKQEIEGQQPIIVSFSELLVETKTDQIQKIPHINGQRTITIRAYPGEEQKAALEQQIDRIINGISKSEEYSITVGGESEARTDFFIEITKLFFIVIFLIYIVMAIQFYSLITPILVMSTVYLAISGAIFGLFITQVGIGFMAMMGIVSLAGIVVRNSIVLIEFIEQRLRDGYELTEAVIEAGRTRLRPILLTALTSIAALLPIAFGGDVLFKPLAISIISGLLFSTIFTVVLVPAFYISAFKNRIAKTKELESDI
ncbi:efflux RND transporter permease subunit [Anaerobacillus alkaliphilus]|nr:efflux RND transporter permease subunit [Anaerobacillus alkaliphilus]